MTGQLAGQQFLCGGVSGDFFIGQKRDDAFLERAKAAFDFAFGLWAGRDQMGDAQRGEGALEFRAGIPAVGRGFMAEQGQAIGVESQGQAVEGKGTAEVLEVVPGGVGRNKDGRQEFARVVIHRQQKDLLVGCGPPLMDRGVVLPEFSQARPFPAAAGLGGGRRPGDQEREMTAGVSGDGLAITLESKAGEEFIRDELVVGRSLERQEVLQELLDLGRPDAVMIATGELEREGGGLLKPGGSQAEEMSATDAQ